MLANLEEQKKVRDSYEECSVKRSHILHGLESIIINSNTSLEGNTFYSHLTFEILPDLVYKQLNLFWCGKQATTKICEIGFNAGHSCMLMLLGREKTPLDMTIFDIGHHAYTKPCLDYIQSAFPHTRLEYVEGDSTVTMPSWVNNHQDEQETFDVVHVDGGHSHFCITNDMMNTDQLVKVGGIIIVDDTDISYISNELDTYIQSGRYEEIKIFPMSQCQFQHRIARKLKHAL